MHMLTFTNWNWSKTPLFLNRHARSQQKGSPIFTFFHYDLSSEVVGLTTVYLSGTEKWLGFKCQRTPGLQTWHSSSFLSLCADLISLLTHSTSISQRDLDLATVLNNGILSISLPFSPHFLQLLASLFFFSLAFLSSSLLPPLFCSFPLFAISLALTGTHSTIQMQYQYLPELFPKAGRGLI